MIKNSIDFYSLEFIDSKGKFHIFTGLFSPHNNYPNVTMVNPYEHVIIINLSSMRITICKSMNLNDFDSNCQFDYCQKITIERMG